jgi:hypothetical protein
MLAKTPSAILAGIAPTGAIDRAKSAIDALSDFMCSPVRTIVDGDMARRAKERIDRARRSFADLEDERIRQVKPLNDQVAEINATYKAIHNADKKGKPGSGDTILKTLLDRLEAFRKREEAERQRIAAEAKRIAAELAQAALEAERQLTEALIDETHHGVVDVDIGLLEEKVETAFRNAAKGCNAFARAERATDVRIGGGFGHALTARNHKTLTVTNWHAAILAIGTGEDGGFTLPAGIRDAILTEARKYRQAFDELPAGITEQSERRL